MLILERKVPMSSQSAVPMSRVWSVEFSQFKFRPHVLRGLRYLNKRRYLIFIVTNQAGIAKGRFELTDLLKLNKQLLNYLSKKNICINEIQFCPFHPGALIKKYKKKTNYRKPGNLMIRTILNKWNVNIKQSFMIVDHLSDKLAAKKSKLYFEYVSRNFFNQVKKIIEKMSNNY